jgi:hypothetical protein
MRHLIPVALLGLLSAAAPAMAQSISGPAPLPPAPPVARTVTAEELVHLRANGLGDEVLVALIESQGAVFPLAASDLLALRQRGLSDRVLTAMLRGGRPAPLSPEVVTPRGVPPMPIEQLEAVVPGGPVRRADDAETSERPSTVVNVSQSVTNVVEQPERYYGTVGYPVAVPVYVGGDRDDRLRRGDYSPEYWGFGGQRRPDSWDLPHRLSSKQDSKPDIKPDSRPDIKPETRPISRDVPATNAKPATRAGGRGGQ